MRNSFYTLLITVTFLSACNDSKNANAEEQQTFDTLEEQLVSRIQTEVDPDYVYEYEQTKFVPPEGKTLLIMGQTVEDIEDYMENFSDEPIPGSWAAYWGVPEFNGITENHTNSHGGTQNHQMLIDRFPNTALHSAMWMVGTWGVAQNTANGQYDDVIKQYSEWVKSINRPVYLRIGYEFDGPHNELEPDIYIQAYRHVVDLMRAEGVDNVAFVWRSYASPPFKDYPIEDWYPGDEYVDWVGLSVFGQIYSGGHTYFGDQVLDFAKDHKKPVMYAESSPINGIGNTELESWNNWFTNFFSLSYQKNIKAISFINTNWEQYSFPGVSWSDARLANNQFVTDAWFLETNKDRYLKQSEDLFEILGYDPE
jgi:hypothetical protein